MRACSAPDFETLRGLLAREIVTARGDDPLSVLDVVVPNDLAGREARIDVARRTGGVLGVRFLSLPRWIDELATPPIARAGGRRLGEPGFERLVARVVEELASRPAARTGALARARETPGLASALAASISDLQEGGFDADSLADWAESRETLRRELAQVARAIESALRDARLWDRRRAERTAAAELARVAAAETRPEDVPLVLFGFHDLSPAQRRAVEAAARVRTVTVLVPGAGPLGAGEPGETAVTPLLEWAASLGAQIEAEARVSEPGAGLTEGLFDAPRLRDPGESLELASFRFESSEVRAIARRVRREVREGGRRFADFLVTMSPDGPPALLFRRIFEKAGVPLEDRAGVPAGKTEAGRRAIRLVRAIVPGARPRDREALAFLPGPGSPAAFDRAVGAFLHSRGAAETIERFREVWEARFEDAPPPGVDTALTDLALAQGDDPLSPDLFARCLPPALAATRDRTEGDGRAVLLVARDAARFVRRPFVFHAGLIEGSMLRPAREDPLLPDRLRRERNERTAHEGRELRVTEDRRIERTLLTRFALESATERSVLSWSIRARVGAEARNPSPLLVDLARERGDPLRPGHDREEAAREPVDATDLHLALLAGDPPPGPETLARLLADPRARHLPAALEAAEARFAPALGNRDGVLQSRPARDVVARALAGRVWSPSSLGRMASCPFSFLIYLLRLDEQPELDEDFTPLERGSLFHDLVDEVTGDLRERRLLPLSPERLGEGLTVLDARAAAMHEREVERRPRAGCPGRAATLAALRNDVAVLLAREAWRDPEDRMTPIRSELAFGPDDPEGPPTFPLPGGRALPFRGRVDRLDETGGGDLVVLDFKTGRPRGKDHAIRATVDGKTEVFLQAPLYLEAIAQRLGRRPARALLAHATVDHGFQEIEFTVADLEDAREELGELLAHLDARARRGWFPCTPGKRCCRRDLTLACGPAVVARFGRKRDDDLARHVSLVRGTKRDPGKDAP